MGDHTTSDDAKKYRKTAEIKKWQKKDPIARLKKYMQKNKMFSEKYEKDVQARVDKIVSDAVKKFESTPPYPPEEIFNYMYAEMPPYLKEQQQQMLAEIATDVTLNKKEDVPKTVTQEKGFGVVGELEEAKE